jgi:hypothetical protein
MTELCVTCGRVSAEELGGAPALMRMGAWQARVARWWGARPHLALLALRAPPVLLALSLLAAYFEGWRGAAAPLLVVAVVMAVAKEALPLAPLPFNVYNVVSSRCDAYSAAARVVLAGALVLGLAGALAGAAERLGAAIRHRESGWTESPRVYWPVEPLPWLSAALLALPLLYFAALATRALA